MTTRERAWRLEELAALAAACLDDAGVSGRVQWVPDGRTLRYYTTLGLLDRPLYFEGRTAFYGRRHLAQVVAIKRLQAAGSSLAEIQRRLAGLPEAALLALAALPAPLPRSAAAERPPSARADADRFWTRRPCPAPPAPAPDLQPAPTSGFYLDLAPGVVLFIAGRAPATDEVEALRRAARPLISRLQTQGRGVR